MTEHCSGTNWQKDYKPLCDADAFENPILRLPKYTVLNANSWIIGSGSLRSGRYLHVLDKPMVSQLSNATINKLIQQIPDNSTYRNAVHKILTWSEPRRSWQYDESGEANDRNLALSKARMTAAAAIVHHIHTGSSDIPEIHVIGRDNNIATRLEFLERPGFFVPSYTSDELIPEGWIRYGDDVEPIPPVAQYHALYEPEDNSPIFFCANSTTILHISKEFFSPDGVDLLTDLSRDLSDMIYDTRYSFMALKPEDSILDDSQEESTFSVLEYYISLSLGAGGEKLYAVPGIIDWSRPPFVNHLEVFVTEDTGQAIHPSLKELKDNTLCSNGYWVSFIEQKEQDPFLEDELVGVSTTSIEDMKN